MAGENQSNETEWGEQKASPRLMIGTVAICLLAAWLVLSMFSGRGGDKVEAQTPSTEQSVAEKSWDSCGADFSETAQTYIRAWGYECDEVTTCDFFTWSRGASVNCSWKYTYYLKDKGGNWVVELQ